MLFDVCVEGLRCDVCSGVDFAGVLWLGLILNLIGRYRQVPMLAIARRVSRVLYNELHGVASWSDDTV